MAKYSNIRLYAEAEKGKRVFVVPVADRAAVSMALRRRGYKTRIRQSKSGVCSVQIL